MSIKKITSAILAVVLCFGTAMPTMGNAAVYPVEGEIVNTYDESKNTLGDVDSNGTIDSVDASLILREYSASSTGQASVLDNVQKICADVDRNGTVDSVDASYILAYYAYAATGGTSKLIDFINGEQTSVTTTTVTTQPATTTTKPKTTTTAKPKTTTTAKSTTTTAKPKTTTTTKPKTTTTTKATTTTTSTTTTTTTTTMPVTTTTSVKVSGIRITRSEMLVNAGEGALSANVTMLPENAPNKGEKWSSSNEAIAIVDSEGWVTGVSEGECVITVTSIDNPEVFAQIKVTVKDGRHVKSIKLSRGEVTMEAGTAELAARVTMLPETAINKSEIWTSSKPEIATVDGEGWVTALTPGVTVIHVKSEDNPAIFSYIIVTVVEKGTTAPSTTASTATTTTTSETTTTTTTTVPETTTTVYIPVQEIVVQNSEIKMTVDTTAKAAVAVLPENATDKSIRWMSSDESIATVDENGVITAKKEGKCLIYAISKDNPVATATITVDANHNKTVTEIKLDKYEMTLPVGGSDIAWVTMLPVDAENKDELWVTDNPDIATVDKMGWVTGISVGECKITVYSVNNPSVKAEIKVTVTNGPVEPPKYTFSQIAPGKSTATEIAFLTPFPEKADGLFIFDYFITDANGKKRLVTTTVIDSADIGQVITMLTAETNHFTAELYVTNLNTSSRAKIGTYNFTINPRNAETVEESIEYAFEYVGGIKK